MPGLSNAHSDCFHRARRGRTTGGGGTFWTWREQNAAQLNPETYNPLARATFAEMLRRSRNVHIVNVGSTSGFEVYPGGSCYAGTKHAVRAITRTLRLELVGEPIRVTEIAPGLTTTEFYEARFGEDHERARKVFDGVQPLTSGDVAECIRWDVLRPTHVNIDELVVRPLAQATATVMHRPEESEGGAL